MLSVLGLVRMIEALPAVTVPFVGSTSPAKAGAAATQTAAINPDQMPISMRLRVGRNSNPRDSIDRLLISPATLFKTGTVDSGVRSPFFTFILYLCKIPASPESVAGVKTPDLAGFSLCPLA